MVYSSRWRAGIGELSRCFDELHLKVQGNQFLQHGTHEPLFDAPLVLIACSGGRDSLALVALASKVCASRGLRCAVVIVDHNLQSSSHIVANNAALECEKLGISKDLIYIESITVKDCGTGVEASARDARYSAIISRAKSLNAAVALLAHTAHDQAETVIMGLRDSAGLEAIAGMSAFIVRDGVKFARPLLRITRDDTTGICEDCSIKWWDDPTNGDLVPSDQELNKKYPLRSRIRHTLMPYISRFFNADMVNLLTRGAEIAQDDLDYINSQVDDVASKTMSVNFVNVDSTSMNSMSVDSTSMNFADNCSSKNVEVILDVKKLKNCHISIRRRVIARALNTMNLRFSSTHVSAIDDLINNWHGQKAISLPKHVQACRTSVKNTPVIRLCNYS